MDSSNFMHYLNTVLLTDVAKSAFDFAWGANDGSYVSMAKRVFLMLPILGIIGGFWMSVFSVASLVVRNKRQKFLQTLLLTWWDMGKAIASFWAGIFKFGVQAIMMVWGLTRILTLGAWSLCLDVFSLPFKALASIGKGIANPSLPWIAVSLTFMWCVFEAGLFTFVTTPLVQDTLSNLTGSELSETMLRLPLFGFMLFIVLGSYSVLATWSEVLKSRNVMGMVKIGAIEAVAIGVEVMFLYREFVDALVPWFAQYSANGKFDLGIFGVLSIATATWFGVRSLSWFLFASSGTPTIMAIIQGTGLEKKVKSTSGSNTAVFSITFDFMGQLKKEEKWFREQGESFVSSLVLPPMQIVASVINFGMVFLQGRHLFHLPFKNIHELKDTKHLLEDRGNSRQREAA